MKLPPSDQTPPEIRRNPRFYPFFKDVLGAIDGTHIDAFIDESDIARFRNRKGAVTQNVLVVCAMDGRVLFALPGWEGSATDARVLEDAKKRGFIIPSGKMYLADAGYSLQDSILTPYRQVRYHLKEWGRSTELYVDVIFLSCLAIISSFYSILEATRCKAALQFTAFKCTQLY